MAVSGGADRAAGLLDPRPLTGEPISLDLLNTVWIDGAGRHDLLDGLDGLRIWLAAHGLQARASRAAATSRSLLQAREAIREHLRAPDDSAAVAGVNAVLEHGALVRTLTKGGPINVARVADVAHLPAWTAAENYLQLLASAPDRIRRCAHPDCVLHFLDTSRKGSRRWCSMSGCGNRAKAASYYARRRSANA